MHVQIEQQAAGAVAALPAAQAAAAAGDVAGVRAALEAATAALTAMQATLGRMGEKCDPQSASCPCPCSSCALHAAVPAMPAARGASPCLTTASAAVYYQRVRLPMSGWRGNPALPDGLIYEGQHGGAPQQLYGETGAQSSILHALDAALGIQHDECSWLKAYLLDMRAHMPPAHRAFIARLEVGHSLRAAAAAAPAALRGTYNDCVRELERFRSQHKARACCQLLQHALSAPASAPQRPPPALSTSRPPPVQGFAQSYIAQQNKKEGKGTGGSDFMPALTGYRDATNRHLLP